MKAKDLIIVGIDGSRNSNVALQKAVDLAGVSFELLAVHAFSVPAYAHGYSFFDELTERAEDAAREVVGTAREEIGMSPKRVSFEIAPGRPAHLLAELAKLRKAKMIVVGSRGQGESQALLGSQSRLLLAISSCPVMVVPG